MQHPSVPSLNPPPYIPGHMHFPSPPLWPHTSSALDRCNFLQHPPPPPAHTRPCALPSPLSADCLPSIDLTAAPACNIPLLLPTMYTSLPPLPWPRHFGAAAPSAFQSSRVFPHKHTRIVYTFLPLVPLPAAYFWCCSCHPQELACLPPQTHTRTMYTSVPHIPLPATYLWFSCSCRRPELACLLS